MRQPRDTDAPLWYGRVLSEIDAADQRAIALAKPLSRDQLNWKASPGEWSIGQCLDHLCVANDVYISAMEKGLPGRPRGVAQEITPGWFGRWFIRTAIEPSPQSRKGKAPRKIVPASAVETDVLDRFLRTNVKAREFAGRASRYDVNRVRFQNPFVPVIFFTIGTGIEVLVRHQRRHLLQAERVRERMA